MAHLSSFESLPSELLEQILDCLDQPTNPPLNVRAQPSLEMFPVTHSVETGLKALSLTSKLYYHAVAPRLYRHLQVVPFKSLHVATDIKHRPFSWVRVISDLAEFLDRRGLGSYVQSLTLYVERYAMTYDDENHSSLEDLWILFIEKQWQNLLRQISVSLQRLAILASPYCLGLLLSIKLDFHIDRRLHMQYHLLILERTESPHDEKNIYADTPSLPSILTSIRWTSLLLNEGSFLRWHADWIGGWRGKLLSALDFNGISRFPSSFCRTVKSIDYIAVSPPVEHILDWLDLLKLFDSLKEVSFQTIPIQDLEPDSGQRGSADFVQLHYSTTLVYQAIFDNLVRIPSVERKLGNHTSFEYMQSLRSMDKECVALWNQVTSSAKEYGWKWEESTNVEQVAASTLPQGVVRNVQQHSKLKGQAQDTVAI